MDHPCHEAKRWAQFLRPFVGSVWPVIRAAG